MMTININENTTHLFVPEYLSGFYPLFPDLLGDFKNFFHQTLNFDAWIGPLHSSFPNIPVVQRTLSCLRKWQNSFLVLKTMESHLPFANPHLIKEWCVWVLYALYRLCPYCLSCEGSRVDLCSMDPEWIWTACCDPASCCSPQPPPPPVGTVAVHSSQPQLLVETFLLLLFFPGLGHLNFLPRDPSPSWPLIAGGETHWR